MPLKCLEFVTRFKRENVKEDQAADSPMKEEVKVAVTVSLPDVPVDLASVMLFKKATATVEIHADSLTLVKLMVEVTDTTVVLVPSVVAAVVVSVAAVVVEVPTHAMPSPVVNASVDPVAASVTITMAMAVATETLISLLSLPTVVLPLPAVLLEFAINSKKVNATVVTHVASLIKPMVAMVAMVAVTADLVAYATASKRVNATVEILADSLTKPQVAKLVDSTKWVSIYVLLLFYLFLHSNSADSIMSC